MDTVTLKQVIEQNVRLSRRANASGWQSCVHKSCDHGKKGPRAAFRFENDSVWFHCFNCGFKAAYIPSTYASMSKEMVQVLNDFGIAENDWKPVLLSSMQAHSSLAPQQRKQHLDIEPQEIAIPPFFYRLTNDPDNEWAQCAIDYLNDRHIDWQDYPYLLAKTEKKWIGRLIIPIFKDNKIIYYQGRDLSGTRSQKYLSCDQPRDKVVYGFDKLEDDTDAPLYVCEGFFDAQQIDGVAVFGSEILGPQIQHLNRCRRDKVIVPDRGSNGYALAKQGVSLGWLVSTPDFSSDCRDVTDAVGRYGLLYTTKTIRDNISSGVEALAKAKIFCGE